MTKGQPLYINPDRMLELSRETGDTSAVAIAMDMILLIWEPSRQAFRFDEHDTLDVLNRALPARGYTIEKMRAARPHLLKFFVELPDGRWAPSPDVFSVVDGNPGSRS